MKSESIDTRLEGLVRDDRRLVCDSKLREFRMDNKTAQLGGQRVSKFDRRAGMAFPVEQMVTLLEEISRRIDFLETRDRLLADEIRRQVGKVQQTRALVSAGIVLLVGFLVICWILELL